MIDILKRIFIGVAISLSVFFLKTNVFALSVNGSQFRFNYMNNGSASSSSYVNTNTTQSFNVSYNESLTFNAVYYKINTSSADNGFKANKTYNITFQIQQYYTLTNNSNYYNDIFGNTIQCSFPSGVGSCSYNLSGNYANITMNWTPSSNTQNATINMYFRNGAFRIYTKTVAVYASTPRVIEYGNVDPGIASDVGSIANTVSGLGSILGDIKTNTGGLLTIINVINNNLVNYLSGSISSNWQPSDFGDPFSSSGIHGKTNGLIGDPDDVTFLSYDNYQYFSTPLGFIWNLISRLLTDSLLGIVIFLSLSLGFACLVVGRF